VADNWYTGNANDDADAHRGWLVGHFIQPTESVRSSADLEIKWGRHPAGDKRVAPATDEQRTTLVLLVSGRHRVELSVGTALLKEPGDYVVWGPGIDHTWETEHDSIVLTVRWPSLAD
jgi:hypothetical protein